MRPASAIPSCCARVPSDAVLMPQIERVCPSNLRVYGADKVWPSSSARACKCPLHAGLQPI